MVLVEIYIGKRRRRNNKNLPEEITAETDSYFFQEGCMVEFPELNIGIGDFTAIKVVKVVKQIVDNKPKMVVYAERYY